LLFVKPIVLQIEHKNIYGRNIMIRLDGFPPILKVSDLNDAACVAVYSLMWTSAYQNKLALCEWSVKAIADKLSLGRNKVSVTLDKLQDAGFIAFDHFKSSPKGSPKKVWRVTNHDQIDARQYAISIIGEPSKRDHKPSTGGLTNKHWDPSTFPELSFSKKETDDLWEDDYSEGLCETELIYLY
jgi:hypothetical protein